MVTAFVLIVVDSGSEKGVADTLDGSDGVDDVEIIYGDYDLIAKIHVPDISNLGDFIMNNIRSIKGVRRTSTLIAVD